MSITSLKYRIRAKELLTFWSHCGTMTIWGSLRNHKDLQLPPCKNVNQHLTKETLIRYFIQPISLTDCHKHQKAHTKIANGNMTRWALPFVWQRDTTYALTFVIFFRHHQCNLKFYWVNLNYFLLYI